MPSLILSNPLGSDDAQEIGLTPREYVVGEVITVDDYVFATLIRTGYGTPYGTSEDVLLIGDGDPTAATGVDGQWYLDRLNEVLWGPKINGRWPSDPIRPDRGVQSIRVDADYHLRITYSTGTVVDLGNIRGPQGAQGTQGPVGMNWRGAWASATAYAVRDVVSYGGSTFYALVAVASTNTTPPAAGATWGLVSAKGETGTRGVDGQGYGGGLVTAYNPTGADPLAVTITSKWGLRDDGTAYYDEAGALAAEAALLVPDPDTGTMGLFRPGAPYSTTRVDDRIAALIAASTSDVRIELDKLYVGTDHVAASSEADRAYVRSFAATDLIANGTGYLGDNTNFSGFAFDPADSPIGGGSFVTPLGGGQGGLLNDELIPVDLNRKYLLRVWARQRTAGAAGYAYTGVAPYDAAGLAITPNHYMFQPGTTTTLAAALNPGDTVVKLTSAANWNNAAGTSTHLRSMIFWGYTDPLGKAWATETYSRLHHGYDQWADGGVDLATNTITLRAAWAGPAYPAGAQLSNGSAGSNYLYGGLSNTLVPEQWTSYQAMCAGGSMPLTNGGRAAPATMSSGFPPGTAFVRLIFLCNRTTAGGSAATSQQAFAAVSFSDATAALADLAAATASSTGNTLVKRDGNGDTVVRLLSISQGNAAYHATRKDYVDTGDAATRRKTPRLVSSSATLALVNEAELVMTTSASAMTLTVPANSTVAFPVGAIIDLVQGAAGAVTLSGATGVGINAPGGWQLDREGAHARLIKTGTDTWWLTGDTVMPAISSTTRPTAPARGVRYQESDTGDVVAHDGTRWVKVGGAPRRILGADIPGPASPWPAGTRATLHSISVPAHTAGVLRVRYGCLLHSAGAAAMWVVVGAGGTAASNERLESRSRFHNNGVANATAPVYGDAVLFSDGAARTMYLLGTPEATAIGGSGGGWVVSLEALT